MDNQIEIPQSFMALYLNPGRSTPNAPQATVIARYEQCEDMAMTMAEHAQALAFKENLAEAEVLSRCHQGLLATPAAFNAAESAWVVQRLAELLGWDAPVPAASDGQDTAS